MNGNDPSGVKGFLNEWSMGSKPDAFDGQLSTIEQRLAELHQSISNNIRNPLSTIHSQNTALKQLVSQAAENATTSLERNINAIHQDIQDHAIARLTPLSLNTEDAIAAYPTLTTTDRKLIEPLDAPAFNGGIQHCETDTAGNLICDGGGSSTVTTNGGGGGGGIGPLPVQQCALDSWCVWFSPRNNSYLVDIDCSCDLYQIWIASNPDGVQIVCFPDLTSAIDYAEQHYPNAAFTINNGACHSVGPSPPQPPQPPVPPQPPPFCCPDLTPFETSLGKISDCLCKLAISSEAQSQSGGDFSFLLSSEGAPEDTTIADSLAIPTQDFDQFETVADSMRDYMTRWIDGGGQ